MPTYILGSLIFIPYLRGIVMVNRRKLMPSRYAMIRNLPIGVDRFIFVFRGKYRRQAFPYCPIFNDFSQYVTNWLLKLSILVTNWLHIMIRDVFVGIADPTRRSIVHLLTRQRMRLNDLAENFEMSRPAVSKHVKILAECGLISIQDQGRERFCQIRPHGLKELADWINQYKAFWNDSLDQLEFLLTEETKNQTNE